MLFDGENAIIKLCARGMDSEGQGKMDEASALFHQAWNEASTDLEKCAAAHYIARHQASVADKLAWDQTALEHALNVEDERMKGSYPSLYLNIGKCLEDLNDRVRAHENYRLALSYTSYLGDDGYGTLITAGIRKGIERTSDVAGEYAGNEYPANKT